MAVRITSIQGPDGLKILLIAEFGLVHDRHAIRFTMEPGIRCHKKHYGICFL